VLGARTLVEVAVQGVVVVDVMVECRCRGGAYEAAGA
jgi:hypothetical protein